MQVEVHAINAKIARPHLAHDCVKVRAVAIEEGAGVMHCLGDL